jgi:acyl-CoA synthetase (AMP-forming)/AMP-acid ligase II
MTITDLLAAGKSDAPAILGPGLDPMTFGDLRTVVERLAGQLNALGIARNDRVAIVLPNGPDMATTFLAVASCAAAAPLNPKYRRDKFRFYLEDLNAKALITHGGDAEEAHAVCPDGTLRVGLDGGGAALRVRHGDDIPTPVEPEYSEDDDCALVLHTSGTTARPKVVPLTQRNLAASAANIRASLALTGADRCLNVMPLFHIHGLIAGLLAPLSAGGAVVCTPGFDGFKFFEWMDELRPTWYTAVPTMHHLILSRASRHAEVIERVGLRFLRSSSASLPPPVMEGLEQAFGAPMIEAYGMTEASHQMASNPLPPDERKPGSVGKGTNVEIGIMDADGRMLPDGDRGEVVIKGGNVVAGYENNPDANAQAYTDGWFRTGDQGYVDDDGYLFLTGRLKEIINRGGEKISPREVDETLLQHPDIAEAVAFAVPHDKLGEDIAAAVVLAEGASLSDRDVRRFAADRLADYKVPRKVVIVDEIPKGPTGKVQRISLAEQLGLSA